MVLLACSPSAAKRRTPVDGSQVLCHGPWGVAGHPALPLGSGQGETSRNGVGIELGVPVREDEEIYRGLSPVEEAVAWSAGDEKQLRLRPRGSNLQLQWVGNEREWETRFFF